MKKLLILISLLVSPTAFAYDFGTTVDGEVEESIEEPVMGTVKMEGEFLDGDLLRVGVLFEDFVSSVLGTSFYLKYDGNKLAFLRYEPGSFLERGGDPFYLVKDSEGKIVFGETLRRDDSFPLGSGLVVDFYFQTLVDEPFEFLFERGVASSLNEVRQDLDMIVWEDAIFERGSEVETFGFADVEDVFNGGAPRPSGYLKLITLVGAALLSAFFAIFLIRRRSRQLVNFK